MIQYRLRGQGVSKIPRIDAAGKSSDGRDVAVKAKHEIKLWTLLFVAGGLLRLRVCRDGAGGVKRLLGLNLKGTSETRCSRGSL